MAVHIPDGLSPDAVDTLTELASIITKLRTSQQQQQQPSSSTSAPTISAPGSTALPPSTATSGPVPPGVTGTTPLPTSSTPNAHLASASTPNPNSLTTGTLLLSVKDLPSATDNLKHKLQRARASMRTMPDMRRTVAQQEGEIAQLRERRRRQAEMLARTQEDGLEFVRKEERMVE